MDSVPPETVHPTAPPGADREHRAALATLLVVGLVAHALRLANDGVFWDHWIIHRKLVEGDWAAIVELYDEVGLPLNPYMFRLAMLFGGPIAGVAILTVGSLVFGAICLFEIARRLEWVSPREALWIALLALTWPSFQATVSGVVFPYLFSWFLFFAGFLLAFLGEESAGPKRWALRIGSLLLLFVSFSTNSFLVLHYGLLAILLLHAARRRGIAPTDVRPLPLLVARHADYLLVPIAFWTWRWTFFRPHGDYTSYHSFRIDAKLWERTKTFLDAGVEVPLLETAGALGDHPFLVGAIVACAGACWRLLPASREPFAGRANGFGLGAAGVVLLAMAIFPYVAIGERATPQGWWSRHTLLMGVPMAILLVACARPLSRRAGATALVAHAILALVIAGTTLVGCRTYAAWMARWVKDRAFVQKLAAHPELERYSLFWIEDRFPLGGAREYAYYEYAGLLETAWGNEKHLGVDARYHRTFHAENVLFRAKRENFSQLDPDGEQALLVLVRGREAGSPADMTRRYLWYRFFAPNELPAFLDGVLTIGVKALPGSAPASASATSNP